MGSGICSSCDPPNTAAGTCTTANLQVMMKVPIKGGVNTVSKCLFLGCFKHVNTNPCHYGSCDGTTLIRDFKS